MIDGFNVRISALFSFDRVCGVFADFLLLWEAYLLLCIGEGGGGWKPRTSE